MNAIRNLHCPPSVEYILIDPNGQDDGNVYSLKQGKDALLEIEDVVAAVYDAMYEVEQESTFKFTEEDYSQWIRDNVVEVAKELGYRLEPVFV